MRRQSQKTLALRNVLSPAVSAAEEICKASDSAGKPDVAHSSIG